MQNLIPYQHKDFSQVIFEDIQTYYPENVNLECSIIICDLLNVHESDYVGLFEVGWLSSRDYLISVSVEQLIESDKHNKIRIVFDGKYLIN